MLQKAQGEWNFVWKIFFDKTEKTFVWKKFQISCHSFESGGNPIKEM